MADISELLDPISKIPKKKEFEPTSNDAKEKINSFTFKVGKEMLENSISAGVILDASINSPSILNRFKENIITKKDKNGREYEGEFVADFGENLSMEANIGLADMMDENIERVRVSFIRNGKLCTLEGTRKGLRGSFYTDDGIYIPVFTGTKVEILEPLRDEEGLNKIKDSNAKIEENIRTSGKLEEFKKKYPQKEFDLILKKALEYDIDPYFLFALRSTENGPAGREFGIIDLDIETFGGQLIHICRNIQNNIKRFERLFPKKNIFEKDNVFSLDFIGFFSHTYAKPGNNIKELLDNYGAYLGHKFGEIDENTLKQWEIKDSSRDFIGKTTPDALIKIAEEYAKIGTRYIRGGGHDKNDTDPDMLDCSGLILVALKKAGVCEQGYFNIADGFSKVCKPKSVSDVKRGDFVFIEEGGIKTHVALATGPIEYINGEFQIPIIDSSTNKKGVSKRYQKVSRKISVGSPGNPESIYE